MIVTHTQANVTMVVEWDILGKSVNITVIFQNAIHVMLLVETPMIHAALPVWRGFILLLTRKLAELVAVNVPPVIRQQEHAQTVRMEHSATDVSSTAVIFLTVKHAS